MNSLGDRLQDLRHRKGKIYTQRKVAADLSEILKKPISHSSYSNWENGIYHPDLETIKALSNYFTVSTDYIIGGNNNNDAGAPLHPELEFFQDLFTSSSFQERAVVAKVAESVLEILKTRRGKEQKIIFTDPADAFEAMLDISFQVSEKTQDLQEIQVGFLIEKAKVYEKRNNYKGALESYEKALDIAKNIQADSNQIEFLYRKQGVMRYYMGYYSYALSLYKESYRYSTHSVKKALNLNNMGVIYDVLGEYDKAIDCYQSSIELYGDNHADGHLLKPFHNLGITCRKTGNYPDALKHFFKALDLARQNKDQYEEALNLNSIGLVYEAIGSYDDSYSCFEKAITIFRKLKNVHEEARLLMNIGVNMRFVGNLANSLETLSNSYTLWQNTGDMDGIGQCLNELGVTHLGLKDFGVSEDCLLQAKDLALRVRNKGFEASTLKNLSLLKLSLDEFEQAHEYIDDALEIVRIIKEPSWEHHYIKAKISLKLGSKSGFYEEMMEAEKDLDNILEKFQNDTYRETFLKQPAILEIQQRTKKGPRVCT